MSETGNGDLVLATDVVNGQMCAMLDDPDDPVDQVIDVHERPGLFTGPLDRELDDTRGPRGQLDLQRLLD